MTAINILILANEAHVFADAGYYDSATLELRALGEKVHRVGDALVMYSGSRAEELLFIAACRALGGDAAMLMRTMPHLLATRDKRFMAAVVGLVGGVPVGCVLEDGGQDYLLRPGSFVKSLATPLQFDPNDVAGSGLAIMEDQRRRHHVVSGHCRHVVLRADGVRSSVLRRWPGPAAPISPALIGAKIQNLTVGTLNIGTGAVTGTATASGSGSGTTISVSVPNPFNFPIKLLCKCPYSYSGTAVQSSASIEFIIKRSGTVIYDQAISLSGNGNKSGFFNPAFIDQVSGAQNYSLQCKALGDPNGSGGFMSMTGTFTLTGAYTQK